MRTRVGAPEPDGDEPEELDVWLAAGFEAENAEGWRQWRFRIAQAEEWKAVGVTEGLHAAQWSTAGVVAGTVRGVAGRGDRGAGGGPVARVRFRVGGGAGGESEGPRAGAGLCEVA